MLFDSFTQSIIFCYSSLNWLQQIQKNRFLIYDLIRRQWKTFSLMTHHRNLIQLPIRDLSSLLKVLPIFIPWVLHGDTKLKKTLIWFSLNSYIVIYNYYIIFHTNNCTPTFALPCVYPVYTHTHIYSILHIFPAYIGTYMQAHDHKKIFLNLYTMKGRGTYFCSQLAIF